MKLKKICPIDGEIIDAIVIAGLAFDNNTGLTVYCDFGECPKEKRFTCRFRLHPEKMETVG